ncbi:MAG TPA: NAD-dependent epimerase/dehydratase family protein, partial [Actinoplanes sp.]
MATTQRYGAGHRILVSGGAGFVPSHVVDALLARGCSVVAVDNFVTGSKENVAHLADEPRFTLVEADVSDGLPDLGGRFDAVLHMASPASPTDFALLPVEILRVGSAGTLALLDRAVADGARFLMASTSEAYGDPAVHPQPESYWGNVNPIGVRAVYDEAKRFSEAATMAYHRLHGVDTAIVRIFNTYGPRMRPDDGRAIPTFISQALRGAPITVQGTGAQTRSITYVDDLVRG